MTVKDFKELQVWQKAMELTNKVYDLTDKFPPKELYTLASQLRRAVVSIPSNIAEGQQRNNTGEFIQFIGIAMGSLAEVETQLIVARNRQYVSETDLNEAIEQITTLRKMLNGLLKALRAK